MDSRCFCCKRICLAFALPPEHLHCTLAPAGHLRCGTSLMISFRGGQPAWFYPPGLNLLILQQGWTAKGMPLAPSLPCHYCWYGPGADSMAWSFRFLVCEKKRQDGHHGRRKKIRQGPMLAPWLALLSGLPLPQLFFPSPVLPWL